MKKFILISVLAGVLPLSMMAQDDDLYFTPKKDAATNSYSKYDNYSGSNRNVDEYNRHGKFWSHYQKIGTDNKGNDIIQFTQGNGLYPDSTYVDTTFIGNYYSQMADNNDDDYRYSQRMSRWDGFYDPWYYSWSYGFGPSWGYGPRWRYGFYDSFYDSWYDPWYSGYYGYPYSYGGWYDPWYYGYHEYPYYGGGYVSYSRPTGTRNHSFNGNNSGSFAQGTFGGSRAFNGSRSSGFQGSGNRSFGTQNNSARFGGSRSINNQNNNTRTFDNSRSFDRTPSPSYGSGSFGGGGGSFGGSRSGGGGFGGGGGHTGGSFGGHR